ncbi:hypothetical protein LQV63_21950 [Paenibacillus profundus]|uniref:Glycosyltransferase RgtA/B/C/D-like domain-containing protein n=1 Tax=Paenibacillus profundus TaxID=1173085 RepID=A0ABS8YJ64_9BACL|nr:hypothetical protein [Paenibacillus profundus]MCE5171948.1 hypothetical protein [Paenibacillus profundus]
MKRMDWITWSAIGIGVVLLVCILFAPPFIGVADNGDFDRILGSGGVSPLSDTYSYEDKYFGYSHSNYEYGPFAIGYVSSQILFVFIAGLLGRLLSPDQFPLEAMGIVYSVLLLLTLFIIVRYACAGKRWLQITVAACTLFIFFDIGYVAYFQSFFGEPVSLIFLLLSTAISIVLAVQKKPASYWLALLFGCAVILAASKIQNAPIGLAFALYAFRLHRKRPDRSWKRLIIGGSAFMIATTGLIYVFAPKELKQINLYQTIFFGILKDSPHVAQDLEELGIPQKYAVLAGTNYFQTDVPIKQDAPELTEHVYSRLGHFDVVGYYLRHPGRIIDKLEAASSQATMIRPYYLGNYEKELGKPRGAISYTYSLWSEGKKKLIPKHFIFFIIFFLLYFAVIIREYIRNKARRHVLDVMLLVSVVAIFSVAVPLVGDGEADLGKHLFLFNVSFDIMIVSSVVWLVAQAQRLFDRSPELE